MCSKTRGDKAELTPDHNLAMKGGRKVRLLTEGLDFLKDFFHCTYSVSDCLPL